MLGFLKMYGAYRRSRGGQKWSPHKKRLIGNGSPPAQNWDLGVGFEGSLHWRCISPAFLNRWVESQNVCTPTGAVFVPGGSKGVV